MTKNYDALIVGSGILGLTTARALHQRGRRKIAILEKEPRLGVHSSGRNSGVLHAGFYYASDSLKAKVCSAGSRAMFEYAIEHQIPVKKTGKVVVATTPESVPQMNVLLERAHANGIRLERIDLKQLHEIEPEARSVDSALFSPDTAVIDSIAVLEALEKELTGYGIDILKGEEAIHIDPDRKELQTRTNTYSYDHLVNTAGLHADKIAHQMNVGIKYKILPFKGVYHKLTPEAAKRFKASIYPVPDLRVPFLGVHTTRNVKNEVYLGPTAIPAFGRENYGIFSGVSFIEGPRIAASLTRMIAGNTQGMRRLVCEEMGRYSQGGFLKAARAIAPNLTAQDLLNSGKVGLRAQLYDQKAGKLVMDFIIEKGPSSTHVLNAISPAFSASMAFSKLIADQC